LTKPASHTWGQISRGAPFGQLTLDLDRALALAGLGRIEGYVAQQVRERSWEPARRRRKGDPHPDPVAVSLPVREMARKIGSSHANIIRAIRNLVARRILIPSEAGHLFNKRADEWLDTKHRPALNASEIAFCQEANERRRGGVTKDTTPGVAEDTTRCHQRHHPGVVDDTTPVSPTTPGASSPPHPLQENARASEELIQSTERERTPHSPPGRGASESDRNSARYPGRKPGENLSLYRQRMKREAMLTHDWDSVMKGLERYGIRERTEDGSPVVPRVEPPTHGPAPQ
jgi:hypothetical protein